MIVYFDNSQLFTGNQDSLIIEPGTIEDRDEEEHRRALVPSMEEAVVMDIKNMVMAWLLEVKMNIVKSIRMSPMITVMVR